MFKALADPTRRFVLDRLYARGGLSLSELCAELDRAVGPRRARRAALAAEDELAPMTRQGLSRHLALLEAANLVVPLWRGREKLHYLNPVPIHELSQRWIGKYARQRLSALSELKRALESQARAEQNAVESGQVPGSRKPKEDRLNVSTGTRLRHRHRQPA